MLPEPRLALSTDARHEGHAPSGFHPERPERVHAALRGLTRVRSHPLRIPARAVTDEEIARAHDAQYIERLSLGLKAGRGHLDPDTYFSSGSAEAARLAAGGACALVDALLDGEADVGALLMRPPGHHATRQGPMGFCLLNNVAIAAAHARARGLRSVAIVDWDVHHGNGTQDIFASDPTVLFISLHQWPLYPGTGAVDEVGCSTGRGTTVNIPLPPHSAGATYVAAFERIVLPILESAAPEIILVSAGFDAHRRDPLAQMDLDANTFGWMAAQLRRVALGVGHGRVLVALEGGYDLAALEDSVAATMIGLLDPDQPIRPSADSDLPRSERSLAEAERVQRNHWSAAL